MQAAVTYIHGGIAKGTWRVYFISRFVFARCRRGSNEAGSLRLKAGRGFVRTIKDTTQVSRMVWIFIKEEF